MNKSAAIAFGREDPYLNVDVARELAEWLPASGFTLIEDAGHYVQVDRTEAVANAIHSLFGALPR